MFKKSSQLLLLLVIVTSLYAQKPNAGQLPYPIKGTITSVDNLKMTVTVETGVHHEQAFTLNSRTSIRLNGKKATLSDLQIGQPVEMQVEGSRVLSVTAIAQPVTVPAN